jgi:DNA-binding NtrC family response regulator
VVVVDDEPLVLEVIVEGLRDLEVETVAYTDPHAALEGIKSRRPAIVLIDLHMPKMDGIELLEAVVSFDAGIEVFLLTGDYSTAAAVEAIQKGAADYLTKPISMSALRARVTRSLEEMQIKRSTHLLDKKLALSFQFQGMVARSPKMLEIFSSMRRIAPHFRSVLLTGRSGTGKELVAKALHKMSPAQEGPFVVCNCAGVPETLAESEWFGYVRGSFTGANRDRSGLFEHANDGVVFLDEIGEMSLPLQAKLLRVLQSHEIQKVGCAIAHKLNLRVIAATNRDLRQEVLEGRFREDLFYRLSAVTLSLPPLSERREDLPLLQQYFVEKFASEYGKIIRGISRRAQNVLSAYHWPGNIRELENVIGNACMMADGPVIDIAHLPAEMRLSRESGSGISFPLSLSLAEIQRQHAHRVLDAVGGNKLRAAEILGISRSTLYSLLQPVAAPGPALVGKS